MPAKATKSTAQKSAADQDKPFVFKTKAGATIKIPSGTVFDPDGDLIITLRDARRDGDELDEAAAMLEMLKSGFPEEVSVQLKLKLSELEAFSKRYFSHIGASLPK